MPFGLFERKKRVILLLAEALGLVLFVGEGKVVAQSGDQSREMAVVDDFDRDSLNTIPLSMIPFETPGLRRALMIKNARYEGVIELFKGEGSGSGQVEVGQIAKCVQRYYGG